MLNCLDTLKDLSLSIGFEVAVAINSRSTGRFQFTRVYSFVI